MKRKFKEIFSALLHLNNTPHEIALGTAIGVFIAILPLYGFHTLLVVIAALLIRRANKIAILAGTNISLPPTVPFITWTAYDIGRFILAGGRYAPLSWEYFKGITFKEAIRLYPPLFLGSLILGAVCAVIFYFLAYFFTKRFKEKRAHAKPASGNYKEV